MKPSGFIFIDGQEVAETLCCVHCRSHWVPVKGSGKVRGFCRKCMGPTCGSKSCDTCVPFEKRLEQIERNTIIT